MSRQEIKVQAKFLAKENRLAEPEIEKVFWFPDDQEVRLVELISTVPMSGDAVEPFYFRPMPQDNLPAPSGIALIRPEEFRKLRLPPAWGSWDEAEELNGEE
jgi:hypothetical protein